MNDNENFTNPGNDGVPNYYGGGVPDPQPQPYAQQPYGQPPQPAPYPQQPYGQQQQQFGGPAPYQQQFPPMNPYAAPAGKTDSSGMISLIASLSSLFFLWIIPLVGIASSLVGVIFGHKALKRSSDAYNSGRGVAITGMICGYLALLTAIGWNVFVLLLIAVGAAEGSY